MNIQCVDGILNTDADLKFVRALNLTPIKRSFKEVQAHRPGFKTGATKAEIATALDAAVKQEQRAATLKRYQEATWWFALSNAELLDMEQRAFAAGGQPSYELCRELQRRALMKADDMSVSEFELRYSTARATAAREGRLDEFEDGI